MFGPVANGALSGYKYICSLLKANFSILGLPEIFSLESKVW